MERYLVLILKTLFLVLTLSLSFFLLGMRKLARFLARNYGRIIMVDPKGAKQVIQGTMGVITWIIGKIRFGLAMYISSYHPDTWRRWRDYLAPRR